MNMGIIVGVVVFVVGALVGYGIYVKGYNSGVESTEDKVAYLNGEVSRLRCDLVASQQSEKKKSEKLEKLKQKKTKKPLTK